MHKTLISLSILLVLVGCSSQSDEEVLNDVEIEEQEVAEHKIYTLFTLNVHDWVHPEDSIETVNKVIDLHEQYDVPVDIFLDDQVLQNYLEDGSDLINRLKTSDVVSVSYHIRPPMPYYSGFDSIGLAEMTEEERYEVITAYEEHALDLETGLYTDAPGGFEYLKELIGYAPKMVGISVNGKVGETASQVYIDKGAVFTVVHGGEIDLNEKKDGMYIRPEHSAIKLYELVYRYEDGEAVFEYAMEELDGSQDEFINLKYHENNFYLTGTPFWTAYWESTTKDVVLEPPYNLDLTAIAPEYRGKFKQEDYWTHYESTLEYAASHADELNLINAFDLEEMLPENEKHR